MVRNSGLREWAVRGGYDSLLDGGGELWRSRGRIIIPAFVPAFTANGSKGSGGLLPEMISPWVMSLDAGEFRLMLDEQQSIGMLI